MNRNLTEATNHLSNRNLTEATGFEIDIDNTLNSWYLSPGTILSPALSGSWRVFRAFPLLVPTLATHRTADRSRRPVMDKAIYEEYI